MKPPLDSPDGKTGLDVTTGSIDRRAKAELEEIETMNDRNSVAPKNLQEFVESVRMSRDEVNREAQKQEERFSSFPPNPNLTGGSSIKEDIDPNGSILSDAQREKAMKGSIKLSEI